MSYAKHTWVDNETITASKLNNIEGGIEEISEEISSSSGYDAVISIYHDNISSHNYELAIESGSYEALKAKFMVNDPPIILAKVWDDLLSYKGSTTMIGIYMYPRSDAPNNNIVFTVKMPSNSTSTHTNWFGIGVEWDSSDEIFQW